MTRKAVPARTGLGSTHTRDVLYAYDLAGLATKTRFDSLSGGGVTNTYDGFGRLTSASFTLRIDTEEPSLRIFPHFAMPVGGLGELRKGPR
jgi:hypothetical protein